MGIRYVAFDVETPNRCNNRISSIGISVIDTDGSIRTREYLVNPECEFEYFNISLTGITPNMVKGAPSFPTVWNEIGEMFMHHTLVAHNASFDLCVLQKTLTAYELETPLLRYICTRRLAKSVLPQVENYKLDTLCEFYGIPLNHHNAGSDSAACALILQNIEKCGIDIDGFSAVYDCRPVRDSNRTWHHNLSESTYALQELNSVVKAISCDGILVDSEIAYLVDWMSSHSNLKGNYPYDRVYNKLAEVLEDGVITQEEHDELIQLFQSADNPVEANACECGCSDIMGKSICLSGEFDYGSKDDVSAILIDKGAVMQTNVTKKTDILVVGGQGSSAWSSGNYGSKIKKALELQSKGIDIMIIREKDFLSSLGV